MTITADRVRATIEVAHQLGLLPVPERLVNLASRLDGTPGAVAIVGLVSRGKSTLVNQLVGTMVTSVAATPETASIVSVRSGNASATGTAPDGTVIDLASDPTEFERQTRRGDGIRLPTRAISGRFRLPPGVVLVDTPGIEETTVGDEDSARELEDQWIESGAGGAVVVVSVPPGIAAPDRELIRRAEATFGSRVIVIVKATSNDVEPDDLSDASDYVRTVVSVPVLQLTGRPSDTWGEGAWAEVEQAIKDLSDRGSKTLRQDFAQLHSFEADLMTAVASASRIHQKALEGAVAQLDASSGPLEGSAGNWTCHVSDEIASSIRMRLEELATLEAEEVERVREKRHQDEIKILDSSAQRLISALRQTERSGHPADARNLVTELSSLSSSGSPKARQSILELACSHQRVKKIGIEWSSLFKALPEAEQIQCVQRMTGDTDSLLRVLKLHPSPKVRESTESRLLSSMRPSSSQADRAKVLPALTDPGRKLELLRQEAQVLIRELDQVLASSPHLLTSAADKASARALGWIRNPQVTKVPGADELMTKVDAARCRVVREAAARSAAGVAAEFDSIYALIPDDPNEWRRSVVALERRAGHVVKSASDDPRVEMLAWKLETSRRFGHGYWLTLRTEHARAEAAIVAQQQAWNNVRIASFWVWGISAIFALGNFAAGLLVWIISIGLWLSARTALDRTWEHHYRPQPPPPQIQAWYPSAPPPPVAIIDPFA